MASHIKLCVLLSLANETMFLVLIPVRLRSTLLKKYSSRIIVVRLSHAQLPTRIPSFPLNRKNSPANSELYIVVSAIYVIRLRYGCAVVGHGD